MLKTLIINNGELDDHLYPNLYRFKKKTKDFSSRKDITSFRLGDENVLEVLTDGEHAGQTFVDNGAKFIKNSSVKRFAISEYDGFYITHKKNDLLKRSKLELHDVLFTTIGKYLGVSAVVNDNLVGANINQNLVRIRLKDNIVSPQYLSCFLNSKIARYQIDSLFTGNTHPILTYPKIRSFKIFLKNRKVHDEITTKLKLAEKHLIDGLLKIDTAQKMLLSSLKIDFFRIKNDLHFNVNYEDLQNSDITTPEYFRPLYKETIEIIKKKHTFDLLGNLADFKSGTEVGSGNYKLYLDRREGDVPFIRTTDIFNYEIDRYPDFYIEKDIYEDLNQNVFVNDILFSKDGKIGLTGMITKSDKCILGSGILRIVAKKEKIDPYYLFTVLSLNEIGLYQAKQRTVIASTLPHLRIDRINDFIIPILSNQKEISEITKIGFELKENSKALIDECRLILEKSLE